MKHAVARRLDLKVLDEGIEAKEKQRESELGNKLPHLSAFAVGDYANPNQRIFPQVEAFKATWAAGLQITWTLNDTLTAVTADHRLAAETDELRADRENLAARRSDRGPPGAAGGGARAARARDIAKRSRCG